MAPGRRRSLLAAALLIPLVATVGVAVFAGAPRSPVVYCRLAGQFFTNLTYSGNAHRSGMDETADAIVLAAEAGPITAHAPGPVKPDWRLIDAATARLVATGLAAAGNQPQDTIGRDLRAAYQDYGRRCATLNAGQVVPPLDPDGLVGQPPSVAYCQRALTLFSDIVANTGGTDQFARDRLLAEAERTITLAPPSLADDWAATVDALRRLQGTGSSTDAAHSQSAVNASLDRLANDYSSRCPTPIPPAPG
jgi:hypothetical protein